MLFDVVTVDRNSFIGIRAQDENSLMTEIMSNHDKNLIVTVFDPFETFEIGEHLSIIDQIT